MKDNYGIYTILALTPAIITLYLKFYNLNKGIKLTTSYFSFSMVIVSILSNAYYLLFSEDINLEFSRTGNL